MSRSTKGFKFNPAMGSIEHDSKSTKQSTSDQDIFVQKSKEAQYVPCFDDSIPRNIPKYKTSWTHGWRVMIKKTSQEIHLNQLSMIKRIVSSLQHSRKLSNVEIHLLWFSYIPQNLFRENIEFTLSFTESTDPDISLLAKNVAPGYLFTHHIFYPGHAVELQGSPIPWKVGVDLSQIGISDDYICGELWIKIVGNQSQAVTMEEERHSQMIALVPLSQPIAGVTLTAPRIASREMAMGYIKRGVDTQKKTGKILKLQSLGVDIEALTLTKKLSNVLQAVPDSLLEFPRDGDNYSKILKIIVTEVQKRSLRPSTRG
ncbi:TPA_asm: protein 3 [Amentotaxus virus 1]|uniref:Protein 3 n=1 Tax=Amentotaxus virus 1 TaxID=2977950 RepID=A0A9N7AAY9_9RHAB|nr:TPA_asm: protein 3 [Amentotaxus virus 1]